MHTHIILLMIGFLTSSACGTQNWPEFRGPSKDGHSKATDLALTWSETENIKWKVPIHDRGWSTPVIWGDQIWMTTALKNGRQMFAVCVSYKTGQVLHDVKIFENKNPPKISSLNSYASPSPLIEAGRLYVHFGTFGTACLDTKTGELLWQRRNLNCDHEEGPGSSPVLFGNLVIITLDGGDVQYLAALNKKTSKTVWKTDRSTKWPKDNDYRTAFGTPLIVDVNGKPQLVSTGSKAAMAYDPYTGRELWQVRYAGWSNSSRPIAENGMVFINTGFEKPELWAVRLDGRGDVTDSHIAWKCDKKVPTIPSPLVIDGFVYMVSDNGFVSCLQAQTGKLLWQERIGGSFASSPVYTNGRIYFSNQNGKTTVIKAGRTFEVLAVNQLDDGFMASPAVVGRSLIKRTKTHLYCIEESGKNRQPSITSVD
ncbi:PQQ-binding-like beta-propeller repeat protein [Planctomycetota bacterium]